jgi:glutamate dehydrogenase
MSGTPPTPSANGLSGAQVAAHKLLGHNLPQQDRKPSPNPTHLAAPGSSGLNTPRMIPQEGAGGSGYVAPTFEGKEKQMEAVMDGVESKGFMPPELVEDETRWFYDQLGIDDMYFATETVEAYVNILCIM